MLSLNGTGNYINAGSRMVDAVGLENMVVVENKDAVFVAPKDRVGEIKGLIAQMTKQGRPELDRHREVVRPWGKYDCINIGERYQVKRITVNPGKIPLDLIEVQSGSYLGEDDIVRFEDRYGRV